jgi:hypothetical protein
MGLWLNWMAGNYIEEKTRPQPVVQNVQNLQKDWSKFDLTFISCTNSHTLSMHIVEYTDLTTKLPYKHN